MPFTLSKPLRFGDCDLTGIAYHPAYFSMLLDVNEAMFTSFDVTWRELMFERRMGLPTVTLHVDFQRPSRYGDVLDFAVHVRAIGRASLDLETDVSVRGDMIWTVKQRIVATSLETHRSHPWPEDVRMGLSRYLAPSP